MTGLLLAGLADRQAAAIEVMAAMTWRDLSCVILRRGRLTSAPLQDERARACHLCVVDLAGLGLRQHSPQNQARLLGLLAGRPAVLLIRGEDEGWLAASQELAPQPPLVLLASPHTSAALKAALQQIMAAAPVAATGAPATTAAGAAVNGRNGAMARPAAGRANGATRRPQHAAKTAIGLTRGGFERLLELYPALRSMPLMAAFGDVLAAPGGHLVRLGPSTYVMDFRAGWLASAYPVSQALMRMVNPRLEGLSIQALPPGQVEAALHRHFPKASQRVRRPLDVIAWDLISGALGQTVLEPAGDLTLHLWRFPNFTRLQQFTPLDVQLAVLCARAPQSLQQLLRAFPDQAGQVHRFWVLAVITGLAVVVPAATASHGRVPAPLAPALPAASHQRRRFFRSLFDRLFQTPEP